MSFQSNDCNYVTYNQFKYKRHLNTKKHIDTVNQKENQEVSYKCNYCNYITKNKWCFIKHNETDKHISMKEYIDRKTESIRIEREKEKHRKENPHAYTKETPPAKEVEDILVKYNILPHLNGPSVRTEETLMPLFETSPPQSKNIASLFNNSKTNVKENTRVKTKYYESEIDSYGSGTESYGSESESERESDIESERENIADRETNEDLDRMFHNGEIKELTPEILMKIIRNNLIERKKEITENKKLRELLESNIERTKQIEKKLDDISKKTPNQITSNTVITNINQKRRKKSQNTQPTATTTITSTTTETNAETTSTTNVNATIHSFLTEKCKNAINIKEFVQSLNYGFESLEYVGQNGYVDGITKLICDRLKELDTFQRPFHCTDLKREILYIKEEDAWEKDTPEEGKMRHIIYGIGDTNMKQISKWQEVYRLEISVLDSKAYSFYFDIIRESANVGKKGERNDAKIASNICKMVHLTREEIKNA